MSFSVNVDTFRPAFLKSLLQDLSYTHDDYTKFYEETHDVLWEGPMMVFKSEAHYNWFILRWG